MGEFVLRCSDICCEKVFDFLLFVISGTTCFLFSELPDLDLEHGDAAVEASIGIYSGAV